jgi:type II secretory pathway component GspD/PulD (secretin)
MRVAQACALRASFVELRVSFVELGVEIMSGWAVKNIFAAGLVSLTAAGNVGAAPIDWRKAPYDYAVVNQSVTDVLNNFGYNTGLRMSIASGVTGTVHGRINAATAVAFLDAVTKSNNLDWYCDGSVMYVSPMSDEQTVAVSLHGTSFDAIKASLSRSGLLDDRYTLSGGNSASFAVVAGPPSYVAVIKQAIEVEANRSNSIVIYRASQSTNVQFP